MSSHEPEVKRQHTRNAWRCKVCGAALRSHDKTCDQIIAFRFYICPTCGLTKRTREIEVEGSC